MPRLRAWGPDWSGNLFACNFNLRKVSRHILHPEGASFRTVDSDLLVSDQTDFHPTDVIEDERDGGSLLIADTGGWYKICCPTSRLMKPEVLGGIYRVRKAGARKAAAPIIASPATHNPAHLISLLDADTRAVRERTARRLIAMLDNSVPTMTQAIANTERPLGQRLACIWTLTRMSGDAARAAVRQGLAQKHVDLRIAAALSAALHRDAAAATESLISLLSDTNPAMRRAAAEALRPHWRQTRYRPLAGHSTYRRRTFSGTHPCLRAVRNWGPRKPRRCNQWPGQHRTRHAHRAAGRRPTGAG